MRHAASALALATLFLSACGSSAGSHEAQATQAADATAAAAPASEAAAPVEPAAASAAPAPDAPAAPASATVAQASVPASAKSPGTPPAAFMQCYACHSTEPGKNVIGPSLAGVYGRKAGAVPGYNYSDALRNSGLVWDAATLDKWLSGPMKLVPGTRMVISVPDPARRQEVIDYLKTLK